MISAYLSNYYLNLQNVISDIPSNISTFLQESLHDLLLSFTMLISRNPTCLLNCFIIACILDFKDINNSQLFENVDK